MWRHCCKRHKDDNGRDLGLKMPLNDDWDRRHMNEKYDEIEAIELQAPGFFFKSNVFLMGLEVL